MAKTTKSCEVMQYMEYMDCDYAEIEKRIQTISNLKTYCIILHDKDVLKDGKPKKPHFHAVLTFTDGKTWDSIAKAIGVEKQYVNKIKTTTARAQAYLIHKNDIDKFQYDVSAVSANFDYAEKMDDVKRTINIEEVIRKIENEEIKPYNVYDAVDAVTYAKHKPKLDRAFEYVQNKKRSVDRDMECLYIYGPSGCGKTTLAKYLASQRGFHTYISSGGKNPLDNYQGEECIVLDDIRGSVFPLADFLKLTDNNTDSLVGCRYYNKSISYCKMIICTSVVSLKDLYGGVTDKEKEPLKQLYRRFKTIIRLDDERMHLMRFDEDSETEKRVASLRNPVAIMFNPKVAKETAQDFAKAFGISTADIEEDDGFMPAPVGFDEVFPDAN
jgi:energy-coupling factor transporter ATP-binding protein EcfA2